jgi:hypothetical protein
MNGETRSLNKKMYISFQIISGNIFNFPFPYETILLVYNKLPIDEKISSYYRIDK